MCRADYVLGKAIRDGQENGTVATRATAKSTKPGVVDKVTDFAKPSELYGSHLSEAGMSTRAIAPAVGKDFSTISRDRSKVLHNATPDSESSDYSVSTPDYEDDTKLSPIVVVVCGECAARTSARQGHQRRAGKRDHHKTRHP